MAWLETVLCTLFVSNVLGHTNMTSYRKLPPLYTLHDCEDSLARKLPSTYCMVFAEIQPDNHSELWHSIEALSNDTFHRFRHDYLFFGLCVEQCRGILDNSTKSLSRSRPLDGYATPPNEVIEYYRRLYAADTDENRLLQHDLLDRCVNYEFQQKYNLTLRTFVEYCDTTGGNDAQIGNMEIIAYVIIALLLCSNICSSIYDNYLKRQQIFSIQQNKAHYTQELDSLGSSILTAFSISRNYKKVVKPSNDSDLEFTYFFRFMTSFFVIFGHVFLILSAAPLSNPEFIENHLHNTITRILQSFGGVLIQIFFVLAGFMLKLKFDQQKVITNKTGYPAAIFVYVMGCIHRYLRLLPSLALLIFFNASLLIRLGNGPFWRHVVEGERVLSKEYWWKNIFMVNNFMMEDSCSHHNWFIAADMQLFALYLLVAIVAAKFTPAKKPLYFILGTLACIVPGILTYIYRLEANIYLKPEFYRYSYFKGFETFYTTYIPFYCNLGGYLVGFICADICQSKWFHDIKAASLKYTQNLKVQIVSLVLLLSLGIGILSCGLLVINHRNTGEPSIYTALYAGFYRNIWAMFSGFSVMFMLLKFGWIAYEIGCSATARVLGRITFQVYLWHVPVLKILVGSFKQTVHMNDWYMTYITIITTMLSSVVAFIMTLFVEYPIGNIINCLLKRALKPKAKKARANKTK